MELFAIARAVVLFIVLLFCCIGTAGPQSVYKEGSFKTEHFFYQSKSETPLGTTTIKIEKPEFGCTKNYDTIMAGYAFAIISCIVAAFALIASVAQMFVNKVPGVAVIGLTGFLFLTLLISWAISESLRSSPPPCSDSNGTYKDAGFKIAYGLALLITAWVLSIVALVLSVLPMVGIKM